MHIANVLTSSQVLSFKHVLHNPAAVVKKLLHYLSHLSWLYLSDVLHDRVFRVENRDNVLSTLLVELLEELSFKELHSLLWRH